MQSTTDIFDYELRHWSLLALKEALEVSTQVLRSHISGLRGAPWSLDPGQAGERSLRSLAFCIFGNSNIGVELWQMVRTR